MKTAWKIEAESLSACEIINERKLQSLVSWSTRTFIAVSFHHREKHESPQTWRERENLVFIFIRLLERWTQRLIENSTASRCVQLISRISNCLQVDIDFYAFRFSLKTRLGNSELLIKHFMPQTCSQHSNNRSASHFKYLNLWIHNVAAQVSLS